MHPSAVLHDTGWGHPEHQGRLRAVASALKEDLVALHGRVVQAAPETARQRDVALVHSGALVETVREAANRARERGRPVTVDADTRVSGASWEAALGTVGAGLEAVHGVAAGRFRNAFVAARPPGHHATPGRAMGFCLFNNIAVAAASLRARGEAERVLIVDWDVHHGNGTQDIFYEDPAVFFLSMHQHPLFPGTGGAAERGRGAGEGTTLNLPMPAGLPAARYVETLLDGLDRALEDFEPDLTLISAGFDAGAEDPLGGFTLLPSDFDTLTHEVVGRTRATAGNRVVSSLEGGYNPDELGRNVVSHLTALRDATA